MLRSPEVMLRAKAMGDYLRFRNVLPKRVSEMVILITAREWTQQYEWSHHYKFALEAGLATEIVEAIADGRRPENGGGRGCRLRLLHRAASRTRASATPPMRGRWSVRRAGHHRSDRHQRLLQLLAMMMNVARTAADTARPEPLERFPN